MHVHAHEATIRRASSSSSSVSVRETVINVVCVWLGTGGGAASADRSSWAPVLCRSSAFCLGRSRTATGKKGTFFFFHRSTPTPSSSYRLSVGLDVGATVPGKSAPLVHGVYSLVHASQRLFASSSFITLLVANKPHIQRR
jgi:hypothetical protein